MTKPLWAPWRLEYIAQADEQEGCVFCIEAAGELPDGESLYFEKHAIHTGTQTITLLVPEEPARAGIDPYSLLDWEEGENIEPVEAVEPEA